MKYRAPVEGVHNETKHRLGTQRSITRTHAKSASQISQPQPSMPGQNDHPIRTKILQRASRTIQLVLKEAFSIHATPEGTRFNSYDLTVGSPRTIT